MRPYYECDGITIYHGDCREVLLTCPWEERCEESTALVTDPPYPNNAGWFDDSVIVSRTVLGGVRTAGIWEEALVFWSELERPPVMLPFVAVHIWHRTNVNGRPYEPIYHFALDGSKRRSDVIQHAAIFDGVGPGCREYLGHPTQKPLAVMRQLIERTTGRLILDPFMGVGATLRAAKDLGRRAVGIEIEERYCEIAARRLDQLVLGL